MYKFEKFATRTDTNGDCNVSHAYKIHNIRMDSELILVSYSYKNKSYTPDLTNPGSKLAVKMIVTLTDYLDKIFGVYSIVYDKERNQLYWIDFQNKLDNFDIIIHPDCKAMLDFAYDKGMAIWKKKNK